MAKPLPTIERLRDAFYLDEESVLRWRRQTGRQKAGDLALASACPRGATMGHIDGVAVQRARVVFALTHGRWPSSEVRHLDGDAGNDAPGNLVDALTDPRGPARRDQRRAAVTSSYMGVSWHKHLQAWTANRHVGGKLKHLGYFATEHQAARAYDAAAPRDASLCGMARNFPDEAAV